MLAFHLSSTSGMPTYLQIVEQVRQALRLGRLEPGDRLPTVREVAAALVINPNTVLKAYRELEYEQLVEGRTGWAPTSWARWRGRHRGPSTGCERAWRPG